MLENLPKENRLKSIALHISLHDPDLLQLVLQKWSNSLKCIDLKCEIEAKNVKQLNFTSDKIRCLDVMSFTENAQDVLHCIAPKTNITLTKLTLSDTPPLVPLFNDLVLRLANLTSLNLFGYGSSVIDEEMEYIFRYLINLRHLILSSHGDLRDIKYIPSKPNITNLKRIQTLGSCWCPIEVLRISNLNFEFKELNKLHLSRCRNTRFVLNVVDFKNYFAALEELLDDQLFIPIKWCGTTLTADYNGRYHYLCDTIREMSKIFPHLRNHIYLF
uniref:F-box domain-containing protein n=1 Tax=Glossina brevipalpis TaxID=37001 RepID=A0A1A9WP01_9MUSC